MKVKSEYIIVGITSIVFIFISIFPNVKLFLKTPPGTVYTFLHNSISDYPYYISFTRQGLFRNSTTDQFTTENQTDGYIHIFYLTLGKIGSIFRLDPISSYFTSRILLGFIFILTSYKLISIYLSERWQRLTAYLIFLTSSSLPKVVNVKNGLDLWPYLYWWTEMDPWQRITFIPHFLMGHIGLVGITVLLVQLFRTKKIHYLIIAVTVGFITGLAHPPSLGMVYYIFSLYIFLQIGINVIKELLKLSNFKKLIFVIRDSNFLILILYSIFILLTIPSLIYILKTTSTVFPWTLMKAQESLFYFIPLDEYLLSIGLLLPLGCLGILTVLLNYKELTKKNREIIILILWVVIDIVMIPLSRYISVTAVINKIPTFANIRYLSMAIQLPLSVLAVIFLRKIEDRRIIFWGVLTVFTVMTTLMDYSSLKAQLTDYVPVPQFVYPSVGLTNSFKYLDKSTKMTDAILADLQTSQILPLYAKNRVYFGQSIYTLYNGSKGETVNRLFAGQMKECEVADLFGINGIIYVMTVNTAESDAINKYAIFQNYYSSEDGKINVFRLQEKNRLGCIS